MSEKPKDRNEQKPIAIIPAVEGWHAIFTREEGKPDENGLIHQKVVACRIKAWGIRAPQPRSYGFAALFDSVFPSRGLEIDPLDNDGDWLGEDGWLLRGYVGPEEPVEAALDRYKQEAEDKARRILEQRPGMTSEAAEAAIARAREGKIAEDAGA